MVKNLQFTENLKVKRLRLKMLIKALKARKRADDLFFQVKYYTMLYVNSTKFEMTDFEVEMVAYITHLEYEMNKEREFFKHVFKTYCSNQSTDSQVGELSQNGNSWHRNTA